MNIKSSYFTLCMFKYVECKSCLPEVFNLFDVTLNHVSNFFSCTFTWKRIETILEETEGEKSVFSKQTNHAHPVKNDKMWKSYLPNLKKKSVQF